METISNFFTLCLIDNFGCSRSTDNELAFHCFAENCKFETANLGNLLDHLDHHRGKWLGFCYACNVQVHDKHVALLTEVQHWDKCHRLDKNGISILCQADNKQSKLQEAVNNARVQRLASNDEFDDPSDIVSLKPWNNPTLKTQEKCRKMMSKVCLYALYKCMGINCAFSTSCDKRMLAHLEDNHNSSTTADTSWLECAYCDLISHSPSLLVQHILQTHGSSTYQCPYCFYRSCTPCNVAFHLKTFHEYRVNSVLVCCGRSLPPVERTFIEESQSKNVFPLRCSDVCNKITYRMDDFIQHLNNSTAHGNQFKCQFCGSNILISEATQHLLVHNIGVYQCIYCLYGSNDIQDIHSHMCHTHPNRLPFICVRLTRKNGILSRNELTDVGSTLIAKLSQAVPSKWLKMCPFTDEELSNNSLVRTTIRANPCPSLAFGEESWLDNHSTDVLVDSQDTFLSYNVLKNDYSSDDWNEHFEINRLPKNEVFSIDRKSFDSGFEDETCNRATISKMDGTELILPENVKKEMIQDTCLIQQSPSSSVMDMRRVSAIAASDDYDSQTKCSANRKRGKNAEKESIIDQFTKPSEPKLSDIFRCRCAYCPKTFISPQSVYKHWIKQHVNPNATFMFQIVKAFQCCYCRHCNTYDDLKRHCERKHSNETFAMIDKINPNKCALCNDSTELMIDHFKEHHKTVGTNNAIRLESYLTDEWLEKIVAEQIHQRADPVSQMMYGCPHCASFRCNNQSEMVPHIRRHFLRYQCSTCKKSFEKVNMLEKHLAIAHAKDHAVSVVNANDDLCNYLGMKIIFPNGLALTKRECAKTRFGAMDELVEMVKGMNGHDDVETLHEQQSIQPLPKAKTKKSNRKRDRSPMQSSLSPKTESGCDDGVAPKRGRGRPKATETKNVSPAKTSAKKSNRNNTRK